MNNLDYCEMWYRLKEKLDARKKKLEAQHETFDVASLDRVLVNRGIYELNYIMEEMENLKRQIETEVMHNG